MPPLPRSVYALVASFVLSHLALITRYGLHGDELYFIECGRHLAWGYVNHTPLVPWLARVAESIGGTSPITLRLPSLLAGAGTLLLTALMVREWRGGALAQWLAGLALLFALALLRMSSMLALSFRMTGGARVFGISFLAIFVVLQLTRGKPYYMAGAYPAMFAAGGVVLERVLGERRKLLAGSYSRAARRQRARSRAIAARRQRPHDLCALASATGAWRSVDCQPPPRRSRWTASPFRHRSVEKC